MRLTETGSIDPDRFRRLLNRDTEHRDRGPRTPEGLRIGGRCDQNLGEVDDADRNDLASLSTVGEEPARGRVVRVRRIKSADQDIGVDDDHRLASSASSRAR